MLEFGKEGSELLIRLLKAEEFRAGILNAVWISISAFKDL
jgi:hypothetical protein